jgi:hypothetical protein
VKASLCIIGKNSAFYGHVKNQLRSEFEIFEFSHTDLTSGVLEARSYDVVLIVCRVKSKSFFRDLKNQLCGSPRVVLISSIVLELGPKYRRYGYIKEKAQVENWFDEIFSKPFKQIIRSGNITTRSVVYSLPADLLKELLISPYAVISCLPVYKDHKLGKLPPRWYILLYRIEGFYSMLRPADLLLKISGNYMYGYTYALWRHEFEKKQES